MQLVPKVTRTWSVTGNEIMPNVSYSPEKIEPKRDKRLRRVSTNGMMIPPEDGANMCLSSRFTLRYRSTFYITPIPQPVLSNVPCRGE